MSRDKADYYENDIIVADDNNHNLHILTKMLKRQGYKVRPVPDGTKALSAAAIMPPDLFLLDIMMPAPDGYEVCKLLKADERTCDIPVIFISALDSIKEKVDGFAVGGVDYITKPFQEEEVIVRVQTHLALRKAKKNIQKKNTQLEQEIAERKKTEEKLRQYERIVSSSSNHVSLVDRNYICRIVNKAYTAASGKNADEIVGHSVAELHSPDIFENIIRPRMDRCFAGETVSYNEWFTFPALGQRFMSVVYSPYIGQENTISGVAVSARDITQLKKAEQALCSSEEKYRELVQNAMSIILRLDSSGNITFFNEYAQEFFGYTEKEIIGKKAVGTIVPVTETSGRNLETMIRDILHCPGKYACNENENIRRDGTRVWIAWTNKAVSGSNGRDNEILCVGADITDRKNAETELQKAKDAAENANHAKSEFLANMSHEIRTPMNAILGFTDLLCSLVNEETQKSYLEAIRSGGDNLLKLINDILDLAKIEAGRIDIQREPVELKAVFFEISHIFSLQTSEKQLEFITEISSDIPDTLLLDEVRFRQIIINLVGNAVKFTEKGHIKLSAKAIPRDKDKIDLIIAVEDTGIGISLKSQDEIFEAFRQQDFQITKKYGGTGLGLTISKHLAEIMNGMAELKSVPGKGSVFEIKLRDVQVVSPVSKTEKETGFDDIVFENSEILIVDDERISRILVKKFLSDKHIKVTEAENGKECLLILEQCRPDIVMMDLRMPVMDGFEALKQIRADERLKHIPVVAYTTSTLDMEKVKIRQSGFDGHLVKPAKKNELLRELARFIPYSEVPLSSSDESYAEETALLSPEVIARLPELIQTLEHEFISAWKDIRTTLLFDEVIDFAEKVKKEAVKYECNYLVKWSNAVTGQMQIFDIERLPATFAEFPEIIKQLKQSTELGS